MSIESQVEAFLQQFVPQLAAKHCQLQKAHWLLETTGSSDAADLQSALDVELRSLFQDPVLYQTLQQWDAHLQEPLLKQQINCLLRQCKPNQLSLEQIRAIADMEASLACSYTQFRPLLQGKPLSENTVRTLLKEEQDIQIRQAAWAASKEIGVHLAPQILSLVEMRNRAARALGYDHYFSMQLDLQEVDETWLLKLFEDVAQRSDTAYKLVLAQIQEEQSERFRLPSAQLGPWAWSDPFCQEDPLSAQELDSLVSDLDIIALSKNFYTQMGIDVTPILTRSDMFERPGKNQHAFCINIDRKGDVRTLNNIQPTIKWMETVLHELGHAIYELGFDPSLPWLLKEAPHMLTTEAMALIAGRQAYRFHSLFALLPTHRHNLAVMKRADESLRRRQLIFSRWVLTMTAFESALYRNPHQDLNALWWTLVEKYQHIPCPPGRAGKADWAAKYHIGLAPVYYFSYLLGEFFASAMTEDLRAGPIASSTGGAYFQKKLFFPGHRMPWHALVKHVTGMPLSAEAWIQEFANHPGGH